MFNAYRLFTGPDGESHVERGSVIADVLVRAETLEFRETSSSSSKSYHTAPACQYVLTLSGVVEVTTRPGDTFTIYPGDILLVEDTTGSGHAWRMLGNDSWKRACVIFPTGTDTFFRATGFTSILANEPNGSA